jgi:hypothetical protein
VTFVGSTGIGFPVGGAGVGVGIGVGATVGIAVGATVGIAVGATVGIAVGAGVGVAASSPAQPSIGRADARTSIKTPTANNNSFFFLTILFSTPL